MTTAAAAPALVPLVGQEALRTRLATAARDDRLPSSLLLHGPPGIGKQRLALWLGALLLCEQATSEPCGQCPHCRLTLTWRHPDLLWFYPRPRLKDGDASVADVMGDLADGTQSRASTGGLYPLPDPTDALFMATMRALVRSASGSPALARRRVFVIGQAERLVPQEGADMAANAFLKLLEEPPRNCWLVLTSNEPAALLPTIRSRLVSIRVPTPTPSSWRELVGHPTVSAALTSAGCPPDRALRDERRSLGAILSTADDGSELKATAAQALLSAAMAPDRSDGRAARARAAFVQGAAGARGSFAAVLDRLAGLLRDETRLAVDQGSGDRAERLARGVVLVERARERTASNANPSLLAATLLRELHRVIHG